MAWVKIDDRMTEHPKVLAAGPLAIAMQIAGLCYCNRNRTRGHIPFAAARTLLDWSYMDAERRVWTIAVTCGMRGDDVTADLVAEILLDSGIWEPTEMGYQIHDYDKYQLTSADEVPLADDDQRRKESASRAGKIRAAGSPRDHGRFTSGSPAVTSAAGPAATSGHQPPDPDPDPDPSGSVVPKVPTRSGSGVGIPMNRVGAATPQFLRVWEAYPHKTDKAAAATNFQIARESEGVTEMELADRILVALKWQIPRLKEFWEKSDGKTKLKKYIAARRWEDDRPEASAPYRETRKHGDPDGQGGRYVTEEGIAAEVAENARRAATPEERAAIKAKFVAQEAATRKENGEREAAERAARAVVSDG